MKKIMVVAFAIWGFSATAEAALDYGVELGVRQQSGEVAGVNFSANSQTAFQGGVFAHVPLDEKNQAHWRVGLLYTQRPLESESDITGEAIEYKINYLDIPFDLLFKPKENLGFYFGFNIAINIDSTCKGNSNCKVLDVTSPYFPLVFGVIYKFTPKWGMDFYLEGANGMVAKGLGDYRAVGLNLTFSVE
ncbi:hypothetical protein D3C87_145850 [compost metagenome]